MRSPTSKQRNRALLATRCLGLIVALVCAYLVSALAFAQPAAKRTVNVYNWSDYVEPGVLADFTRETGIAVKYDTFDANELLETKLLAGRTGYDIVAPTGYFLERQIKVGLFQPLEKAKLPNLVHVWPEIERRLAEYDPGNRHAVNYMWGTTGIGYNARAVRERLGSEAAITSWDLVFRPELIGKFRDCGIDMLDSVDDILAAALQYLKLDPNTRTAADFERAGELLARVRPFVRKFHSSEYLNALAGGEICLAVGWSGDIKQAQKRAAEAKNGVEVRYAIPQEGAQMWFDNFAIPKDAKNVNEAHAFIDFMLRPEIAARNSNFLGYANGNATSQKLIDPAVLNDPTVYPRPEMMQRLYVLRAHDQATSRLLNRLWTRIKTGR